MILLQLNACALISSEKEANISRLKFFRAFKEAENVIWWSEFRTNADIWDVGMEPGEFKKFDKNC